MSSVEPNSAAAPEHPTLSSMQLDGVRAMEPVAWSRMVTTFGPIVYRWCRTSGVKESEAPDVVQEVFASVARGIATFEREKTQGSFRSWLATITRNKVRDHFRHQAKSQQAEGGTEALMYLQQFAEELDSTICAETAEASIVRLVLGQVEAEFEPATWRAFWLTTIENRRAADVSAELGVSAASVYQAKSRVLRRLRGRLAELP